MNDALVSVILPTYNRGHLLRRAIESVLAQTHGNLELIVVDDASTDDTPNVIASFTERRVMGIRLGENAGGSRARNVGIEKATGELVTFIDSDDHWSPLKLERQVVVLESSPGRPGLCVCSLRYHRGQESWAMQWKDETLSSDEALRRIAGGAGYGTLSWMVRRDVLRAVGDFDITLPRLQDYELSIRIASHCPIVTMSDILVTAEIQADSVSASADRYARAIDIVIDKHRDVFERNRAGYSHMVFRAGKYLALERRYREAIHWFNRAWRIHAGNIRALGGTVLCLTGLFPLYNRLNSWMKSPR